MFSVDSEALLWERCSKGTKRPNMSVGHNINISLTHIKQISRSSAGTYELHKVNNRVVMSPMSFHLDSKCLQCSFVGELGASVDVLAIEMAGLKIKCKMAMYDLDIQMISACMYLFESDESP